MSMRMAQRSFAGGEITPELYGRLDLTKYQTGLRLCRNAITLPHGPADRRPGTHYVANAKFADRKCRLHPFNLFSSLSTAVELGHLYARFHSTSGTILRAARTITGLAITGGELVVTATGADTITAGETVYVGPITGVPDISARYLKVHAVSTDDFTLRALNDDALAGVDVSGYTTGGTLAAVFELVTPYTEADLWDIRVVQSEEKLTLAHPSYPAAEIKYEGDDVWSYDEIDFEADIAPPTGVGIVRTRAVNQANMPYRYVVTAVAADDVTESLISAEVSTDNNLTLAGNYNTITWNAVTGASFYNVYRRDGVWAFVGSIEAGGTLQLEDKNITPDRTKNPPTKNSDLNTAAGKYPAAAAYHEQRRWFASTDEALQTVWATRSGTDGNLTTSVPTSEDDSLRFRVVANQLNVIRHIVPLADLIVLTDSAEWRVWAEGANAITPSTVSVRPQSYVGANRVQPATASNAILYVQAQGSRIRELRYDWETSAYKSIDASIMSPHLFDQEGAVVQLSFQRTPEGILWALRDDGVLLGMTYIPEHEVLAWHQHTTDGLFESVAVIKAECPAPCAGLTARDADIVFLSVQREVNGETVRTIERMYPRFFVDQADAFYVDCGLQYSGAPAQTFTGLWHLEGKTVSVLYDGAVHPDLVVANGRVTLEKAASKVSVGLRYTTRLQTLPAASEQAEAGGQGANKNIVASHVRVHRTALIKAGPSFEQLTDYPDRATSDPYGHPPALRSEELRMTIAGAWDADGSVCLESDAPTPFTVSSIVHEVQPGG